MKGVGHAPGDPLSTSLDASYHKEQEYIWFKGGDLNSFCDIRSSMNCRGWGIPTGTPSLCHWMRLIIRNKNIYVLEMGI